MLMMLPTRTVNNARVSWNICIQKIKFQGRCFGFWVLVSVALFLDSRFSFFIWLTFSALNLMVIKEWVDYYKYIETVGSGNIQISCKYIHLILENKFLPRSVETSRYNSSIRKKDQANKKVVSISHSVSKFFQRLIF